MSEVDISQTALVSRLAAQHLPALGLHGLEKLAGASVSATPLPIHDTNGELLFHDHYLVRDGDVVGTIRAAANRKLGVQIVAIYHSVPRWNATAGLRMARESFASLHPEARITKMRLVCYAYPKIGVELRFTQKKKEGVEIFDASSGGRVADSGGEDHQFTRYSLLERLGRSHHRANIARYEGAQARLAELQSSSAVDSGSGLSAANAQIYLPPWPLFGVTVGLVLQSPWCPNSPMGNSHYAQITDYFCVDASAQMLLEHYGFNYTQNQIAVAMGTTPPSGTTGAGLTSGFQTLTNNDLVLSFDNGQSRAQQFQDAVNEVDANRPLFTQVPHHYRVCMGYSTNTGLLAVILGLDQALYIFDPWPWNPNLCEPGSPYWESWSTSPVMWFGIVHHA
jgi:hypothetical protein